MALTELQSYFHSFKADISGISLPKKFNFPFYYQTHRLSEIATEELQLILEKNEFDHVFGLDPNQEGTAIGKMFGVLIVQKQNGELGYLSAFSGKLANSNNHEGFVPPVFDMLTEQSFYKVGEIELHQMTIEIESLQNNQDYLHALVEFSSLLTEEKEKTDEQKLLIQRSRLQRSEIRKSLDPTTDSAKIEALNQESIAEKLVLKNMLRYFQYKKDELNLQILPIQNKIAELKEKRAAGSAELQQLLFDNYTFLNSRKENKSLSRIFEKSAIGIPAGAGECAAPKLIQFAYLNDLKPIALAEFWWGQSPKSEVRIHKHYYPSCRGKCEPILGHMLEGIEVDENPLLQSVSLKAELSILYEDDDIMVIDKPAEFLTVPGKNISESVYTTIKEIRPEAEGPLIVHRLDMSTSGCLLIAKTEKAYTKLQRQFIKRTVKKRYIALLEGIIEEESGTIDLPLRVDLEDRPRQLVCYEHGSKAVTHFKVIEKSNNRTRIEFYPITGRTHQLRVHSAHSLGLKTPIVGDDLYGTPANRLHLHAEFLSFDHPTTKKTMKFNAPVPF